MDFETIFYGVMIPLTVIIYIVVLVKFRKHFPPLAKGIKKRLALKWYLQSFWFNGVLNKRRFCTECGWEITYIDDLYDIPIEAISPDAIAECPNPKCLTQYSKYESWSTGKSCILPLEK